MLAILNSLNAHNFPIFQPILIILASKFMVHRCLSFETYLSLGLLSPLILKLVTRPACKELKSDFTSLPLSDELAQCIL